MAINGAVHGDMTYTADVALEAHRRVKVKSGTTTQPPEVEYCGANDRGVGWTLISAAADELITVRPFSHGGSILAEANEAAAVGASAYGGASGKVSDTATTAALVGVFLEASAADGDIVEVFLYGAETPT